MSEINSKNYEGANIVVVGKAGGEVEYKSFDNGGSQAQLSIAVGKGYKDKTTEQWVDQGTDWYTLTATADYARQNWPDVQKGDKVRVDDSQLTFKAYAKRDGSPGVEATLRYGTLVIVEAKADRAPAKAANSDETPW